MKKTLIIIIVIFLLIFAGIGYVYLTNLGVKQSIDSGDIFSNTNNFFPFGDTSGTQQTLTDTTPQTSTSTNSSPAPVVERLFQISSAPVAGYVNFDVISTTTSSFTAPSTGTSTTKATTTKQTQTLVRFIERATGHLYEVKIPSVEKTRVSNITSPKIYDAILSSKGDEAVEKTLNGETVETTYIKITQGTSTANVTKTAYPASTDIVVANGDRLFYTTVSSSGSTGFLSTFDRKKPTQVFSTPLQDILAAWSGGDVVAVFSKPHSDYEGALFFVNTKTGVTTTILSGIKGLTALPNPDASYVLYNTNSKTLTLAARKVSTVQDTLLSIPTLPEKCVWSKKNVKIAYCAVPVGATQGGYPEKWYQGAVSFTDALWSINAETGDTKIIYSPFNEKALSIDMTNLTLSAKEDYIFFDNKKDLTLWGLSLPQ